jgi:hypothetical protein
MVTPSVERPVGSRLLPQMPLGRALLLLTAGVVIAWLGRLAWMGAVLPRVLLLALGSLLLFELVSIVLFLMAWVPAAILHRGRSETREGNPFAADQLPPQILPPRHDHV